MITKPANFSPQKYWLGAALIGSLVAAVLLSASLVLAAGPNLAAGKVATGSIAIQNAAFITDADKTTANYAGQEVGLQWIQLDLGQSYNLNQVNVWHYFGDGRTYHDVIVQVSNDAGFASKTTVFNNDSNNTAGQGAGSAAEYAETSAGKTITFTPVSARYVRLWLNGSSANTYNHYVEVEVYAVVGATATNTSVGPTATRTNTPIGPSATPTRTPTPGSATGVIFYQDINYGGVASGAKAIGDYGIMPGDVPNDWMSSLRVPAGWAVDAYADGSFGGALCTYTADTAWVGTACNDNMSSFRIRLATTNPHPANELFDDFSYTGPGDGNLTGLGWAVRNDSGGPGPAGAQFTSSNITFVTDPSLSTNKIMQMRASTSGTAAGTTQSEIYTSVRKYLEGTYAARFYMSDAPSAGSYDGDEINETFFTITPLNFNLDPAYSEDDFEYLPNGGWGVAGATMWNTTWETYQPDPWIKEGVSTSTSGSLNGWHILLMMVSAGHVKYYVDGNLLADHSGIYYPETPMSINFNLWFIADNFGGPTSSRTWLQQVDWVYHARNTVLTQAQVTTLVADFRAQALARRNTMP